MFKLGIVCFDPVTVVKEADSSVAFTDYFVRLHSREDALIGLRGIRLLHTLELLTSR